MTDLTRMELIEVVEDRYRLTQSGRMVASAIALVRRLSNVSMSH